MDRPADIFISYCHEDQHWLTFVRDGLRHRLRTRLPAGAPEMTMFTDRELEDGQLWETKIKHELKGMRAFVLLVSEQTLRSEFIREEERPVADYRFEWEGVPFIPLLVEACDWTKVGWLAKRSFVRIEATNGEVVALATAPLDLREKLLDRLADSLAMRLCAQPTASADRSFLLKRCDRDRHSDYFQREFAAALGGAAGRLQVWLVHGHESQNLLSFTERLHEETLKKHPQVSCDQSRSPQWLDVRWPEIEEPLPARRVACALLDELQQFSTDHLPPLEDASFIGEGAKVFAGLWRQRAADCSLLAFRFESSGGLRPGAFFAVLSEFAAYLRAGVEEAARRDPAEFERLPPMIFLFCAPTERASLPVLASWTKEAVASGLTKLQAALAPECGLAAGVPKLDGVRREHVRAWFRQHGRAFGITSEEPCRQACAQLFHWWRRRQTMRAVESHLEQQLANSSTR